MTPITSIPAISASAGARPVASGFDRHLAQAAREADLGPATAGCTVETGGGPAASPTVTQAPGCAPPTRAEPPVAPASSGASAGTTVDGLIGRAVESRRALDAMIDAARDGRTWSPAQLLAVQSAVHRHAARLELTGKVVEQASRSVRTLLETRV